MGLGGVGIGTATPYGTLALGGPDPLLNIGGSTTKGWGLQQVDADNRFRIFEENSPRYGERLTILSGGNVGIGTTQPGQRLTVAAGSDADGVAVLGSTSLRPAYRYVTQRVEPGGLRFYSAWHYLDGLDEDKWKLRVGGGNNFDTGVDALTVTTDGNVGIGTTSPSTKLDVVGDAQVLGQMSVTTYSGPSAIYADNGNQDVNAAGVRGVSPSGSGVTGESSSGSGVTGKSSWTGVAAHNNSSDKHAFLATASYAGQFNGDVIVRGNGPGQTADLHVTGDAYARGVLLISDRNKKTNIAPVDARSVLEKVAKLPVATWSFKDQKDKRHIGPMAQDFHAAFEVGLDDKTICSVDADGVALAAIQGLYQLLQEKDAQMKEQRTELDSLKARMVVLEQSFSTLAANK